MSSSDDTCLETCNDAIEFVAVKQEMNETEDSSNAVASSSQKTSSSPNKAVPPDSILPESTLSIIGHPIESEDDEEAAYIESSEKFTRIKPSQEASEIKISVLQKQLNALYAARDAIPNPEVEKQIFKVCQQLKVEERRLRRKKQNAEYQKKHREKRKRKLEEICSENKDIRKKLSLRESVGRPRLEQDQPLLLKTIADIAIFGGAPGAMGETDSIRSVKTLDELTQELKKKGFNISRSGTYLRLLPRNSTTVEGRRHVSTVPVKLSRAQTDHHRSHIDSHFATTSIRYLENLASILGPAQVLFICQDDRARVPIGLTEVNKQAPLLMHMEYRASLPDHDWVTADNHKLIPSIYAGIEIRPMIFGNPQAMGSGPTFIAVRSGKHCSSSANAHAQDFETLLDANEFQSMVRTEVGSVKPVVIIIVDGGPDENPRYHKVISFAVQHFKKYDLDALFIASNAPGQSSFNIVERRMALLSRELAGLILPQNHFASLLDDHGCTVNKDLEKSNFQFAGKVLAEVWNTMIIDGHPVHATYIECDEPELPNDPEIKWYSEHVRESQYLLQVVKCKDATCCTPPRSGIFRVLTDRFLPPPVKVKQTVNDLIVSEEGEFLNLSLRLALNIDFVTRDFLQVPYDYFCSSVKPRLSERTCRKCGLYHSSNKSANRHRKNIHGDNTERNKKQRIHSVHIVARRANELMCILQAQNGDEDIEWFHEEEVDVAGEVSQSSNEPSGSVIIDNFKDWIRGTWSTD